MKKSFTLLLVLLLILTKSFAQITNYSFASSIGTYAPITGTVATVTALKDGVTSILPIGFDFWYEGVTYNNFGAGTNGKIRLGGVLNVASEAAYNNLEYYPQRPILAPLHDRLSLNSANGLTYQTSGTAPNRVLTVQWQQVKWIYEVAIEFQLKLYEGTNNIEFIYNPLSGSEFGASASIGITARADGPGNFLALVSSSSPTVSSTSMGIIGLKPPAGRTYKFIAPQFCSGMPTGGTTTSSNNTICAGYSFNLSVTGASDAMSLTYQWQKSPDGVNWTDITNATNLKLTTSQNSATYYRRAIICAGSTSYSTSLQIGLGAAGGTYAAVPYYQDFDSAWLSNCGVRELPSLNWQNNPTTGIRSWRRDDDYLAGGWPNNNGAGGPSGTVRWARFHVLDDNYTNPPTSGDLDLYLDCSQPGSKELRFRSRQDPFSTQLSVYYSTDGGANFTLLAPIPGLGQWKQHNYLLPSNSATTIVRFRGTGIGQPYSSLIDVNLDDVRVVPVTCFFPTGINFSNILQTSITASWNGISGVAGYEYAVSSDLNSPASGTFINNPTVNLTGLIEGRRYYLHVRTKCSATEFSSWEIQSFTTSINCSTIPSITCGIPVSATFAIGYGAYNLLESDPSGHCGAITYGQEKLYRFTPTVSGSYTLKINSIPSGIYPVHYYIKDASTGCSPVGWTCLGVATNPQSFSMGNLTAGREYFVMLDNFTIVNSHTQTIEIICPVPNPDCLIGTISPASASICPGGSRVLTTSGGTSYQWFRNGVLINGATNSTISVDQPGVYSVSITNGTCTAIASNTVTVTQTSTPGPAVTVSGATNFCEGGSVTLSSSATVDNQWYKDGVIIPGANGQNFIATESGSYSVRTIIANCMSELSSTTNVMAIPRPTAPVIIATGNTTFCQGGTVKLSTTMIPGFTYQWQKDNVDISGATNGEYIANTNGSYSIKVINNGNCSTNSNIISVTVNTLPATPVISASGPVIFCFGNSVQLTTADFPGYSYQWRLDGAEINGANSNTYTVTANGDYSVRVVTSSNCSALSSPFTVGVRPLPSIPVITTSGNTNFCQGGQVVLSTTAFGGVTYQWTKDGSDIPGASSETYIATAGGSYRVRATNFGNCSSLSLEMVVTVKPNPPVPTISFSGNTTICEGTTLSLQSSAANGNQWYRNSTALTGATGTSFSVAISGDYWVKVTDNGCTSQSGQTSVVVNSLPEKPVITAAGNLLTSSAASGNQWILNSTDIPNAVGQQYTAQTTGIYKVRVTKNDCSNLSNEFNFVATGIVDPAWNKEVVVYPNPVQHELYISNKGLRRLNVKLMDINGRKVAEFKMTGASGTFNVNKMISGTYLILITDLQNAETVTKIIIKY